ncbi:MAG: hypothetical protein JXQ83_08355 [Candidatus Glassbacteria bacterium]|nr:hypothetical protein [Candidatus Glassbacteria bacterium]
MTLGVVVFLILLFSVAVLFVATNIYRRQRMLEQKKAEYLHYHRQQNSHWALFRKAQANIDRIKGLCKNKQAEFVTILQAVEEDKKEIKETLEILKKETRSTGDDFAGDLGRIIERRKTLIKKRWLNMNGKKAAFIGRRKELQALMNSIDREIKVKDRAYEKWLETKGTLSRIKIEYERISNKPVSAFIKEKEE